MHGVPSRMLPCSQLVTRSVKVHQLLSAAVQLLSHRGMLPRSLPNLVRVVRRTERLEGRLQMVPRAGAASHILRASLLHVIEPPCGTSTDEVRSGQQYVTRFRRY